MKVLILYRPESEHGRLVEEFVANFKSRRSPGHLEVLNVDGRDGSSVATLYDVVQYPAILVLRDDGSIQRSWQGDNLPLLDELQAYATA